MCDRFLNSFVDKVIEKSCCESCKNRRNLCKNLDDEYNHLDRKTIKEIIRYDHDIPEKLYKDLILSFLHNQMFQTKYLLLFINYVEQRYLKPKLKRHNCFDIPNCIVFIGYDNYIEIYDTLEDIDITDTQVYTFEIWLNKNFFL